MARTHRLRPWMACLLALALAACGDDGPARPAEGTRADAAPSTPEASPPAPHPIEFVRGLAAGVEAAGDPDALLFVYLARHHPT